MTGNPIYELYIIFGGLDTLMYSMDLRYIKDDNKIIKSRFREACDEAGIRMPEKIADYEYI